MLVRPLALLTRLRVDMRIGRPGCVVAEPEDGAGRRRRAAGRGAPPPPEARAGRRRPVESSPPKTTNSPDGWTLTVSAKDETQRVTAPLTTAISTREYEVGGIYSGSLIGPRGGG